MTDPSDPELLPPGLFEQRIAQVVALAASGRALATASSPVNVRWQDPIIAAEIPTGSRVLDLGCGDGELLERLQRERGVSGQGIELDQAAVEAATARDVAVLQADLNEGLAWFPDGSFDVVVLEQTLQTLRNPLLMLSEMLRVGGRGIVSFPNFAHWRVIADLTVHGRMPVTEQFPFHWYDSDNIHPFALQDLLDWVDDSGARIVSGHSLSGGVVRELRPDDNLHAEEVLVVVEKRRTASLVKP